MFSACCVVIATAMHSRHIAKTFLPLSSYMKLLMEMLQKGTRPEPSSSVSVDVKFKRSVACPP